MCKRLWKYINQQLHLKWNTTWVYVLEKTNKVDRHIFMRFLLYIAPYWSNFPLFMLFCFILFTSLTFLFPLHCKICNSIILATSRILISKNYKALGRNWFMLWQDTSKSQIIGRRWSISEFWEACKLFCSCSCLLYFPV